MGKIKQMKQLWVDPETGALEIAIELCSYKSGGTFGPFKLYLPHRKCFINNYTAWDFWCELQNLKTPSRILVTKTRNFNVYLIYLPLNLGDTVYMRTLLVETMNPNENEIRIELVKRTTDLTRLIDLGMRTTDLVRKGVSEFLTPLGAQVRVTLLDAGTFIAHNEERGNV